MNPDLAEVPQGWALYKEVQEYYEKGMRVPDDVTLLWCDDNWGNIRRLPTAEERKRSGGAGIYYHFDYVGGSALLQMAQHESDPQGLGADESGVPVRRTRIWIVNVGDLKPMEFPIEFFLTLALGSRESGRRRSIPELLQQCGRERSSGRHMRRRLPRSW